MRRELTTRTRIRTGFTLVELLIVIGIIVLLIGLLLPALGSVSDAARNTKTESLLQDFSKACDLFFQDHGEYPGVIPELVLANDPQISGTENALLHLMGGYRVLKPEEVGSGSRTEDEYNNYQFDREIVFSGGWRLKVFLADIGNGPFIKGKQYEPYFSPAGGALKVARGQWNEPSDFAMPDLVDSWGTPVIYLRRARSLGDLAGLVSGNPAQFVREPAHPYLLSDGLGEQLNPQTNVVPNFVGWSMLNVSSGNANCNPQIPLARWNLETILGHQAFATGTCQNQDLVYTTARGDYLIMSAGRDGVFFARTDGEGTTKNPQDEITVAAIVDEFDDIVVMGGGS